MKDIEKEIKSELHKILGVLDKHESHSEDEINALGHTITIRAMKNAKEFAKFCIDEKLSLHDAIVIMMWIKKIWPFLKDIDADSGVTYDQAYKYFEQARVNTIIIHRLNYILHECMIQVYDMLDDAGRLEKFKQGRAYERAEVIWERYKSDRMENMEKPAWYALQDHLRIACDLVMAHLDKARMAVIEDMQDKGLSDVELRARCLMALLMGKVAGHSYKAFFRDFRKESGVDYTKCFDDDDLREMQRQFSILCDAIGFKTTVDDYGYWMLKGYDPEPCKGFMEEWDLVMKTIRDDDLMDDSARQAIELNPDVQEDFEKKLEEYFDDKQT